MNPFVRIPRHRRGCVDDGGSTAGAERRHYQSSAQEGSDRVSQLQGSLSLVEHAGKVLLKSWPIDLATSARKLGFFPRKSAASGPNVRQPI